ncbi:MAG: hypothetical protein K0S05_3009, partial [Agromyces sp.]|nr:hypothetical protein [Agromyces sp.]
MTSELRQPTIEPEPGSPADLQPDPDLPPTAVPEA